MKRDGQNVKLELVVKSKMPWLTSQRATGDVSAKVTAIELSVRCEER